ncbi:hypothetical protein BC939DRAFT_464075 [Gamsiella multidivaricata]|uniref:uncharacterized protein n=1 Tax=Gamsiella multidivaricata TaxID=101098 RepID=UPI00221FF998|nr:uncharacterized protein BC939DRAFT_464075 [Gamsiella multidivaricata]KAG0366681.1 autophagy- protein 2 [Gamsiella multidivaricata]KAI7818018.1 hypothetical protein BC939DRAFT_464075 [Gamsiella multidivaricata]
MKAWGFGNLLPSFAVPLGLQKRILSFVLQRAIGNFLEDDLDLEKLDIELSNGVVHLTDLKLNARALNDLAAGTPLAVTQGRIGSITATIPWRNLWNGQCIIEIDGADVTLAPVRSTFQSASLHDLEDQILSASVGLASDFIHQHKADAKEEAALQESLLQTFQSQAPSGMPGDFNSRPSSSQIPSPPLSVPIEEPEERMSEGQGVQFVARVIEKLLARIQIICKGTVIRLRHSSSLPLVKTQPIGTSNEKLNYELEIRLPYIAYRDETPGWDQPTGSMDASSMRSSSLRQDPDSASSSTVLGESGAPSVIWLDSPESIKTVVFRGFSIWVRQQGEAEEMVVQVDPMAKDGSSINTGAHSDGQEDSDSDSDVFTDAQENISQSIVDSQMAPLKQTPLLTPSQSTQATSAQATSDLYAAEILSTLQHKSRIKVSIRKNTKMISGSTPNQADMPIKSLMDIDFHLRSIFIALSPNQVAFILEILALMDSASPTDTQSAQNQTRADTEPGMERGAADAGPQASKYMGRSAIREDAFAERASPIHTQSPQSPKRLQTTDPLKGTQARSSGSRPLDNGRPGDSWSTRATATIPTLASTPTVYMDSSRFLRGSIYVDSQPSASPPSSSISNVPPSLTVKLKARINTFQVFVLYQDPASQRHIPTEANFFKNPVPEALRADHLKLELDSMVLRYQQWTGLDTNTGGQKTAKEAKSQVDFALNNFSIAEWIESAPKRYDTASWNLTSDRYRLPSRRHYVPIVEFEMDQDSIVQTSPTSKFPVLHMPDRYLSERSLLLRSKKSMRKPDSNKSASSSSADPNSTIKESSSGIAKEVVKMRVLLGNHKRDGSKSSTPSPDATTTAPSGYARDVTIEVKPMQVHVDFTTFQRLENFLLAIMGSKETTAGALNDQSRESQPRPLRQTDQQILDDLEGPQRAAKVKARLRLRLNSVQLWISVPDMALLLAGQEDTGPEYRSIYDVVAVNISKMVVTQTAEETKAGTQGHHRTDSELGRSSKTSASKMKVEFASISAFIVPAHETTSKAFLFIGSLSNHPASQSSFTSTLPTLEIVTRSPSSLPISYERSSPSGFPRTPALEAFEILENEEYTHSYVDEKEELIHFKQRTIETSLVSVDTHVPLVAVHLEKRVFDILMLRINDLSTWLTIFSERLAAQIPATPEIAVKPSSFQNSFSQAPTEFMDPKEAPRNSLDEDYQDDQSELGTDQSTAYGEELRHQAEGRPSAPRARVSSDNHSQQKVAKPTMASVLLFAQTVEVTLDYPTAPTVLDPVPTIKSYQITVRDARVFAAAKYQGGIDTYAIVDADDLDFWEITAQKPKTLLLSRTFSKPMFKPSRPMVHMTSLLSFDPAIKYKENKTNLSFAGISWKFSIDQTAVDDVQDFFAEPAGIVYYNPPRQCTRIGVSLLECCMDYKPLHIPPRFVLSFEKMKVFSTLIPESPTLKSKVQIYNMSLFLIDNPQSVLTPPDVAHVAAVIDSRQYWRLLGFAIIGQCPFFELRSVKSKTGQLPLYDLMITNQIFYLETCSDSFQTLMQLATYLGDNGDMPIEKKKILERLAEAERAANRAKSNIIYQDVLASLDEDAFRKPSLSREADNTGTLEFVEGFYSVDREDSESDHFKAQMHDTPNVDGFHEVYADLLSGPQSAIKENSVDIGRRTGGKHGSSTKGKGSKSKAKGEPLPPSTEADEELDSYMDALGIAAQTKTNARSSFEGASRGESSRSRDHSRTESQPEDIIRVLDSGAKLAVIENYFSIPVLTEEERAKDEGSMAKLRLRVRDFNFSWRLYDGLDWEISRLDEAERKRHARQLVNRLYDPDDVIHATMDIPQSNLEASIFEKLAGVQHSPIDRLGVHHRKDSSPSSSEADSTNEYQTDTMSQDGNSGNRPFTATGTGSRRIAQYHLRQPHSFSHQDSNKRKKKLERSKTAMIEFNADKVRLEFEDYLGGIETASHLSLRVKQFEIIDNLKSSLWHKFLSRQRQDSHTATPHQTQSNMIRIDLDGVRPVVSASTVEHRLKVRILPLRLYVDQDALIFLIKFFVQSSSAGAVASADDSQPEGMAVAPDTTEKKKPNEMYFQSVKMGEISVKVDYKPKHVDYTGLTGGNFVELMNFFHLDAAEMTLQEVQLNGINGFVKLGQDLITAWLPYIRSTQVPHMVSGLTPIRSLVNLGSGIADLVLLPIEQYKRDGHLIRGLQKGGQAFTRATTLEALKLGTKLAVGTQVLLEHADEIFGSSAGGSSSGSAAGRDHTGEGDDGSDIHSGKRVVATMVSGSEAYMQESIDDEEQLLQHLQYQQQQQHMSDSGTTSSSPLTSTGGSSTVTKANRVSKYANQPADINEGMELAYKSLSKNIGTAAHTIFAVPMEVYERTGTQGSVRAVIRAVPVAVLKPMIGATEAFSKVLIGLRNSIDPAQRLQMEDKYKKQ